MVFLTNSFRSQQLRPHLSGGWCDLVGYRCSNPVVAYLILLVTLLEESFRRMRGSPVSQKELCYTGFQLGCTLLLAFHSTFETLNKTFRLTVGGRVEWGRGNMLDTISLQKQLELCRCKLRAIVGHHLSWNTISGKNGTESINGLSRCDGWHYFNFRPLRVCIYYNKEHSS